MFNDRVRTRAEMEAEFGSVPPVSRVWTIHRSHASVTYVTDDGGEHWIRQRVLGAAERSARDDAALAQARIQEELK